MGIQCPIKTINPFDTRACAWNIAKDCTSPVTALQIATILIPDDPGPNVFFSNAARHLLTGVLIALHKTCPGAWTFRDVVLAMKSRGRLEQILGSILETRDLLEYFVEERTAANILSTAWSKMAPYEPIAAAWSHAKETISLQDWAMGNYILVLGNDEACREALDAVNAIIFKRVTELLLSQSESSTRRTWVFLDEVREAGKLGGLSRLLTQGRSKGVSVCLTFAAIEGLIDAYGEEGAKEIVGQCNNKALLRSEGDTIAQWESDTLGAEEKLEYPETKGSERGQTISVTEELVKRESVLTSQFMTLPPTDPANGLSGYYLSPEVGAYFSVISGEALAKSLLSRNAMVADFLPVPEAYQYLTPWTKDDLDRLRLGSVPARLRILDMKQPPKKKTGE